MKIHKQLILSLILLLLMTFQMQVKAEQKVNLSTPIQFTLDNDLNLDKTQIGENITLVVSEDVNIKNLVLKKGTALNGNVLNFTKTKRYRRNGYFECLVKSINYPDKGLIILKIPIEIKIYDTEIMERKNKPVWMKTTEAIAFCCDNVIPGAAMPFYIYETFKYDKTLKSKSKRYKWGIIIVKSTTSYYYADFFRKHKNPCYKQGDAVKIKFKKGVSKEIFGGKELTILK